MGPTASLIAALSLPGPMVCAEGVRASLGKLVERFDQICGGGASVGCETAVELLPHEAGHLSHVGWRALATLDLHAADARGDQAGQHIERVESGRLLERVKDVLVRAKSSLAECWIACGLARGIAIDQHAIEARLAPVRGFLPAYGVRWRAHALHVGRVACRVGGERAAPFHHHAQAAETKDFDLDSGVRNQSLDLSAGEH